jgi:hypothetical protein
MATWVPNSLSHNIHNGKSWLLYIMVEICEVKDCNNAVKMHHFEKKDEKDTGALRHICEFHYNQIKENGLEPEYETYITHGK